MVIKPSIVLAAAVLTAASFVAPSTATAQHVQSITVPIMGEGIRNAKIVSLLKNTENRFSWMTNCARSKRTKPFILFDHHSPSDG
jgi:hypothetical protein